MTPDPARSTREPSGERPSSGTTRRQFVQSVGAGAIAATAGAATTQPAAAQASRPFVQTDGTDLVLDGDAVYFHGANNFWITDSYRGEPERIDSLFAQFEEMGIDLVRTFVACEGGDGDCYMPAPYEHSEGAYETLDYLIASAAEHGIRLVLVLADNWDHNGGAAQYVEWTEGASVHGDFFANEDCRDLYRWHVEETLTRENSETGLEYREDPTIAFWELCNEPRIEGDAFGEGEDPGYEERAGILEDWLTEMAEFVKDIDPNHLISTGMEGFYTREDRTEWFYSEWTGQDYLRHHDIDAIDVCTFHWYPYHWNLPLSYGGTWIEEHVRDAHEQLGKPAYMGEFNVNRDSGLEARNEYLAEWYEAADAYDCDAATIWQIVLEEMHDHDGFQVYRSESGDVLGEYRDAVAAKSETKVPADASLPYRAPTSTATRTTGSAVRVDWSSAAGADEYTVTFDGTERTTRAAHATFDGLSPDTEYEIDVAAGSGDARTDAISTTATTVGPDTVDAPAWEYGTAYEEGDRVVHNGVLWEAQWYTDEEEPRFESGYAWTFVEVLASPLGVGSDGPAPPAEPTDVAVVGVSESSVEVEWAAVDGADSYRVYVGEALELTAETTTATVSGLQPGTDYSVGVAATNEVGTSDPTYVGATTAGDGTETCGGTEVADTATVDGRTVCDVSGDGLHRDVTADGSVGQTDVVEFFEVQHRDAWKQPSLFDFSGNGSVGHGDVIALFEHVATGGA